MSTHVQVQHLRQMRLRGRYSCHVRADDWLEAGMEGILWDAGGDRIGGLCADQFKWVLF